MNADFLVIGGGIIGLNIARELRRSFPDASVHLLEKEADCGLHASGRNSGVLHAGFYYSPDSLKAQFKVVKLANSTLSDGEIASQIIKTVNLFFDVTRWDFGETFYFTELSAFIHQQLANIVASVVVVPTNEGSNFGDGFEIRCRSDELFISTAQVSDVVLINSNTSSNLKIR